MIRLVIFDFDGTIVHTAPDIAAALNEFRLHHKMTPLSYEEIVAEIGTGLRGLIERTLPALDPPLASAHEQYLMKLYEEHHLRQVQAFEGLQEFLQEWPYMKAIVSNKSERYIHSILKHLNLDQVGWKAIVGGDTFEFKKPHALPFHKVLEVCDIKPHEALIIGDGEPDVLGAAQAQISCVAVGYGYCSLEKLMSLGAQHQIQHLKDLIPLINQLR